MNPDFPMFQDSSRAKILIHHGNQIHQKDRNDKKQAYSLYFACNWQQPFLNQRKEKNDHRN